MPKWTQISYLNGLAIDNLKPTDFTFHNTADDLQEIANKMTEQDYKFCVAMFLGSMEDSEEEARKKHLKAIKVLTKYNYK